MVSDIHGNNEFEKFCKIWIENLNISSLQKIGHKKSEHLLHSDSNNVSGICLSVSTTFLLETSFTKPFYHYKYGCNSPL